MKRLNLWTISTRVLFGTILMVCGLASSARGDDHLTITYPTDNATVNVPAGSALLDVEFTLDPGFVVETTGLQIGTNAAIAAESLGRDVDDPTKWTASFPISEGGTDVYIFITAYKPADSSDNQRIEAEDDVDNITIIKGN